MVTPTSDQASTASALRGTTFHGSLPLAISFPHSALSGTSTAFIQANRNSYLPLLVEQLCAQLGLEGMEGDGIWFDFQGRALRSSWNIGLLFDYHTSLSSPSAILPPTLSTTSTTTIMEEERRRKKLPWRITMHLDNPPEGLLVGCSVEDCRAGFMNRLKESDFVRWGSVKRVTNLRKEQQDALWDGVVLHDEEKYWTVASRLIPLPSAPSLATATFTPATPTSSSMTKSKSTNSTTRESTLERLPEGNNVRSIPLRIYSPDGAPVIQDLIPPLVDGKPITLGEHMYKILPTLFPSPSSSSTSTKKEDKASILIQGIIVPSSMELGWMGSCLVGADGWVSAVLVLH